MIGEIVSRFYGITVSMGVDLKTDFAGTPHCYAVYEGDKAALAVDGGELLKGALPSRAIKLVTEWIALRRDLLNRNWRLMKDNRPPEAIPPLE